MADEEAKTAVAIGHVIDFNIPEGKAPVTAYVGGIRLSWWKTIKDTDDDLYVKNPMTTKFKEIVEAKHAVKVKYEISTTKSKDGTREFTNNVPVKVATEAETEIDAAEITKGDAASETEKAKPRGGKGRDWQPRDESPVASRWAWSTALDLAGEGVDVTKETTFKALVKTANKLIEGAFETQKHAKELWGKAAAAKAAGPKNSAADAEPEKKEIDDF